MSENTSTIDAEAIDAESAAADAPPAPRTRKTRSDKGKPRGPRAAGAARPRKGAGGRTAVRKSLGEMLALVGGAVSLVNPTDGMILATGAPDLAEAWANVAERHPRIRQAIMGAEAGGVYGAAILATAAVLVPIALNHNLVPRRILGNLGPMLGPLGPVSAPPPAPGSDRAENDPAGGASAGGRFAAVG